MGKIEPDKYKWSEFIMKLFINSWKDFILKVKVYILHYWWCSYCEECHSTRVKKYYIAGYGASKLQCSLGRPKKDGD